LISVFINDRLNDFDLDAALEQLSAQRREQTLRYRHEFGRRASAVAYLLLCQGLKRLYDIDEKPLFTFGEHGKPSIVGHTDIHFNLSHCKEAAICAISDRPVGVDIESPREYRDSLVRYTMNDREVADIIQSSCPDIMFTRLWTMKEAVVKLSGHGISNDMKHVLDGRAIKTYNLVDESPETPNRVFEDNTVTNMPGLVTVDGPGMRYIYSVASEQSDASIPHFINFLPLTK